MRRLLIVGLVSCMVFVVSPASAKTPASVVGNGPTRTIVCTTTVCSDLRKSVTVTTIGNTGVLNVPGVYSGTAKCVRSAKVNGVVGAIVSTPDKAGRHTYLFLNEGGGPDLAPPQALVQSLPASLTGGGDCGTSFTASELASPSIWGSCCTVPANRYTVVGG